LRSLSCLPRRVDIPQHLACDIGKFAAMGRKGDGDEVGLCHINLACTGIMAAQGKEQAIIERRDFRSAFMALNGKIGGRHTVSRLRSTRTGVSDDVNFKPTWHEHLPRVYSGSINL